jgi:DNA-directed RNA polymerase delta subunit
MSILDTIIGSQTQSNLASFQPSLIVNNVLSTLKERDRDIITRRFALGDVGSETLESIGKLHNLTRERVRQIEKDCLKSLKTNSSQELQNALQVIFDIIVEHGSICSEDFLLNNILSIKPNEKDIQSIKFLLNTGDQFNYLKESDDKVACWYVVGFNMERLTATIESLQAVLNNHHEVMKEDFLIAKFCETDFYKSRTEFFTDKIIQSYLNISKNIQINPFGEIGLKDWVEVKPHDVGDKAYLVLKHHGKPEHYSEITKLINEHKFDNRVAYQETVHNELIKDSRFVLIGRGIYALTEWGYKKGVVADVIKEILTVAGRPMHRDEIIAEVLKRRQVKRNTILVGLSNKKNFQKVDRDKYIIV